MCGAITVGPKIESFVQPGDHVAALVPDLEASGPDLGGTNESWILAEVVSYETDKQSFQVDDVDAEEGKV